MRHSTVHPHVIRRCRPWTQLAVAAPVLLVLLQYVLSTYLDIPIGEDGDYRRRTAVPTTRGPPHPHPHPHSIPYAPLKKSGRPHAPRPPLPPPPRLPHRFPLSERIARNVFLPAKPAPVIGKYTDKCSGPTSKSLAEDVTVVVTVRSAGLVSPQLCRQASPLKNRHHRTRVVAATVGQGRLLAGARIHQGPAHHAA